MTTPLTIANFATRAAILTERGIPVVPVNAGEKRCTKPNWPNLATTNEAKIQAWQRENSDFNTAAVCLPDGICVLDADSASLMGKIGRKMPQTFTVLSAGRQLPHFYFKQTDKSRALGNRNAAGLFDFQQGRKYVVGPGSALTDGRTYNVLDDSPIVPIPDWLCDWIEKNSDRPRELTGDAPELDENFDFAAFLAHYNLTGDYDGDWFFLAACPFKGALHSNGPRDCGIYCDNTYLRFSCLAGSCAGHGKTIGQLIAHLNRTHEPYPGVIWPEEPGIFIVKPNGGIVVFATEADKESWLKVQAAQPATATLTLRRYTEIEEKGIDWMWPGYLAAGKLSMINGEPGSGKSLITLDLAARITTGKEWPDGAPNTLPPSDVVLITVEEDASDTIKPRFLAAGGDPKHLFALNTDQFSIENGVDALARVIREEAPDTRLIIFDPVSDFTLVNPDKDNEVRPMLAKLLSLASELGLSVLGIAWYKPSE